MINVVGEGVVLINAGISVARGNYTDALLDASSAIPFAGNVIGAGKLANRLNKFTKGGGKIVYIGKVDDLKNVPRNQTILDELPDLGNPKANWKQNSSVLRRKVSEGYEIRDASKHRLNSDPDPTPLRPDRTVRQSFLGAERNLLKNLGITPK